MVLHYHGTPINPVAKLYELAGRNFCVSHYDPRQVARCHEIGQSVMLDNSAYSKWKSGLPTDWPAFYGWCEQWLAYPTTWAVIPDVIDGGSQVQDALLREWPFGHRGAPVWHMDEPLDRLLPWLHMLRGMQLSGMHYPFASVDSTDVAQNHNRPQNSPRSMATRWDAMQCPGRWVPVPEQLELTA